MKTNQGLILVLTLSMLIQTACTTSAKACPTPTSGTKLLTNTEEGYCLLYPAEDSTSVSHFIVINPINAPGDMPGDAWVNIYMQDSGGRTATQVADAQIAAAGSGFNITKTEVEVDGEKAIVIDGLPGQDSNRLVIIVSNDRFYTLTFEPWYPSAEGIGQPTSLEYLYKTIIESMHFTVPTNA